MRYCVAKLNTAIKDKAWRDYIADAIRIITENTAKGVGGTYLTKRYTDIINPKKSQKKDTRTGDEIVADLITGLFGKE